MIRSQIIEREASPISSCRMTDDPEGVAIARPAKIALVAMALLLFVPLIGMGWQSQASLEQFHNRTLRSWPPSDIVLHRPADYFLGINNWLADRLFPIIDVTRSGNNILYWIFGTSPRANVVVSRNGFVFLSGDAPGDPYNLIADACTEGMDDEIPSLQSAFSTIAQFGERRHVAVDVVLVPTLPTLYGDELPRSLPAVYRHACRQRAAGNLPLATLHAVPGMHFLYPYAELRAARNDWAFYPVGNWHPDGLSVKTVRDLYLRDIGAKAAVPEDVTRTSEPSELLSSLGVWGTFPVYDVASPLVTLDQAGSDALQSRLSGFYEHPQYAHVYRTPDAANRHTVLMISDSFGDNHSRIFAAGFRDVVQVYLPDHDLPSFLTTIAATTPFDRVLFLFTETNFRNIALIGQSLSSATHDFP